jgi:hypothetical protein
MKGGIFFEHLKTFKRLPKLRESLKPGTSNSTGSLIDEYLNRIATTMYAIAKKIPRSNYKFKVPMYIQFGGPTKVELRKNFKVAYATLKPSAQDKIRFIPEAYSASIDPNIKTLIDSINESYKSICSPGAHCGDANSRFKLRSDDFKQMLERVCQGQIYQPVRGRVVALTIKSEEPYVKLKESLAELDKIINYSEYKPEPPSAFGGHATIKPDSPPPPTFYSIDIDEIEKKLDLDLKAAQDATAAARTSTDYDDAAVSKAKADITTIITLKSFYGRLHGFFGNNELDKAKMKCMACMIVMPNFESKGYNNYGYDSFELEKPALWTWKGLGSEMLQPNMYCPMRVSRRHIASVPMSAFNISKLKYTMSPLFLPENSVNKNSRKVFQKIHNNMLTDMMKTLPPSIDASIKGKFENGEEIKYTRVHSDQANGVYVYYELEIYKKKLKSATEEFDVVVVSFKVFSEDGICGKEAIFVSYLHDEEDPDFLPPPLPSSSSSSPEDSLPGLIIEDVVDANDVYGQQPYTLSASKPVTDDEDAKKVILDMFSKEREFLELTLFFGGERIEDKEILEMINESTNMASTRTSREIQNQSQGAAIQLLNTADSYNGISTVVLTQNGKNFNWSIAKASKTQISAFNTVQNHIKDTTKKWKFQTSQKTFEVNNRMSGPDEIKVDVTVKEVDLNNILQRAEYKAKAAPTYQLFAIPDIAARYIQTKMGIIASSPSS